MARGWKKVGSYYYYITLEEGIKIGQHKIGANTFYFDNNGRMKKGWVVDGDNNRMYYNSSGKMLKGWQTISKKKYYFDTDGIATIGLAKLSGNYYYFNTNGDMAVSSWKTVDDKTYYIDSSGKAAKGVVKIKGVNYVFDKDNCALMNGFNADSNGNIFYLDADGKRLTDFQWVEGTKYFFNSQGVMLRKNAKKFIDVSEFQTINWPVLSSQGDLDGIIIRLGYTGSLSGKPTIDASALSHIKNAQKYGIPYGVYYFGRCSTTACAKAEGDWVVKTLRDNKFKPIYVFYDAEVAAVGDFYKTAIPIFGEIVEKEGYKVGVYASLSWLDDPKKLNVPAVKKYAIWVAQWHTVCQYKGARVGWQYSSKGRIAGISGNVDMNLWE